MTCSLAQLKRDFKEETICARMLIFCGNRKIPDRLLGIRKAAGANSTAIFFRNNDADAQKSELSVPRASLVKYTGDYLITYYPSVRELSPEEERVVRGWEAIASTPEYQERARIDALTDGSSTYWQEKRYYAQSQFPYLFGTEEHNGCKRIIGGDDHGKIRDSHEPGKIQNVYRIYADEDCSTEAAVFPNWRCNSYVCADNEDDKEYGYQDLMEYFFIDGTDTAVCLKDFGEYAAGDICRVREGAPEEHGGFYIRKRYRYATNIVWDTDLKSDRKLLPRTIRIPDDMEDIDEISDYLSDVTGFCHKGFRLED